MHKPYEQINYAQVLAIAALHLAPFAVFFTGTKPLDWIVFGVLYFVRMFFVTGAFHRYFAHRTYKTSRWFQFLLAIGASTTAQRGVLWWAGHHRNHHWHSDQEEDVHSPIRGFLWSHIGWTLDDRYTETPMENVRDLSKFPELVWINNHAYLFWGGLGVLTYLIGGLSTFLIGFVLSTVVLSHATFFINSFAHVFGQRRYVTKDTSKNSFLLALLVLGEGWHNNHHHFQGSARNGFFWWEIDVTYYILKVLSWMGLIWDLRPVPEAARSARLVADGHFDIGEAEAAEKRKLWGPKKNPAWGIVLHGTALLGSVAMLVLLLVFGAIKGTAPFIVGSSLFGASLILFYMARSMRHYLPSWSKAKEGFKRMDNVMGFILMAATYTPVVLSLPAKGWAWGLFGTVWGIAVFAVIYRLMIQEYNVLSYGIIGTVLLAFHIVAAVPVVQHFSGPALSWLLIATAAYAVAVYVMPALEKLKLYNFSHVALVLGSVSHFWFLFAYVL